MGEYEYGKYKKFVPDDIICPLCWGLGYVWKRDSGQERLRGQVLCPLCKGKRRVKESEQA